MHERTRHPGVAAVACRIYGVLIRLYPTEIRDAFADELRLTFRTRVEDVLNGGIGGWLAFAAHVIADTARLHGTLAPSVGASASSLLGLNEGELAQGCLEGGILDGQGLLVAAGLGVAFVGWFAYFAILPRYVL
jgi:hypothetical protein